MKNITDEHGEIKNSPNPDILLLDLSIRALLVGLFSNERLANDISAVTLVMIILKKKHKNIQMIS